MECAVFQLRLKYRTSFNSVNLKAVGKYALFIVGRRELRCLSVGSQFTVRHYQTGMALQRRACPHNRFFLDWIITQSRFKSRNIAGVNRANHAKAHITSKRCNKGTHDLGLRRAET